MNVEIFRNKKVLAGIAAVLSITAAVSVFTASNLTHYSQAKYGSAEDANYSAELQDFDVGFTLKYMSGGTEHSVSAGDLAASHGTVRLTLEEYSTLSVDVDYTGGGKCYYRFKMDESWQHHDNTLDKDVLTDVQPSTYHLAEGNFDNRDFDGYIYSINPLKDTSRSFTLIESVEKGADAADLIDKINDASQFVDITFTMESVQWNRASEVWKLTKELNGHSFDNPVLEQFTE